MSAKRFKLLLSASGWGVPSLPWGEAPRAISWQALTAALLGGMAALGRILTLLILVVGLGTIYEESFNGGALPRIQPLASSLQKDFLYGNSTDRLAAHASLPQRWQALQPVRHLLGTLSPEMNAWLEALYQEGRIVQGTPSDAMAYDVADHAVMTAAYRHVGGRLYLTPAFWQLSDGEKLLTLAHEYCHARQSLPKRVSRQLARLLGGRFFTYGSSLESEAFAFEASVQNALGLSFP